MSQIKQNQRPKLTVIPTELTYNWNIPEKAKVIFSWFYLYKDKKEGCWASNGFLARNVGIESRSVSRHISLLEKWKYIKIINKTNKRRIYLAEYEKIYSEVADKIYEKRRSPDNPNFEGDKQLFKNALSKYLETS